MEATCVGECAPGELLLEDGCCQPAGLPPNMPCPPGELLSNACLSAGLPLDMLCLSSGLLGESGDCPSEDCPKGQMVIPGEAACHGVAPCGSGDYGDIPVDPATTQFVNQAYAGLDSDGSEAKPWKAIQQGIDAAPPGAIVAVAQGTYSEDAIIQHRPVVLWGRCPALVEVAGTGAQPAAVQVLDGKAAQTEIRGLGISGLNVGLLVSDASEVQVHGVWVHDTMGRGLEIQTFLAPTSAMVTDSLIEETHTIGVLVHGADADLSRIVVRNIQPDEEGNYGHGIVAQDDPLTNERAKVQVNASVVERTQDIGVLVTGSDAELTAVVVRDTQSDETGRSGRGIHVQDDPVTNERANVRISASLVDRNHETGVLVHGSDAELTAVVVRDTQPDGTGNFGRGIQVQDGPESNERANVRIIASLVEHNRDVGVIIVNSDTTIEASIVRYTSARRDGLLGDGIVVWSHDLHAEVTITATIVDSNARAGLATFGATARFDWTMLSCNGFDLQGEVYKNRPFEFPDSHDNFCGCPAVTDSCNALSAGFSPPPLD